jgi:hypothetical protein
VIAAVSVTHNIHIQSSHWNPIIATLSHIPGGLYTWINDRYCFNFKVFGRYLAIGRVKDKCDVIYTQDDDCIVSAKQVTDCYESGVVVCNVPSYRRAEYADGIALVGWGCVFHRDMVKVFDLYFKHFTIDDLFLTECDRVFTGLNKVKLIDVPFTHLPNAESPDRLHKRPDHWDRLREIRERVYFVKQREGI